MAENIIFQPMDNDFVEPCPMADVEAAIRNANSLAVDDVYHFNIHLERCSSDAPYGFFAYNARHGFLVSLRIDRGSNHLALVSHNFDSRVAFSAGQHELIVPTGLFIPTDAAVECARTFCDSGSLAQSIEWVRYDQLGLELYA